MWLNDDHRNDANFCLHLVHLEGSPLKWLHNLSASGRGAQTLTLGSYLLCETKKAALALKFCKIYVKIQIDLVVIASSNEGTYHRAIFTSAETMLSLN